jgi:hypothetical protein
MLNADEAADALHQASAAERRSAQAYRYQRASPYLYLWGLIWLAGYGGSDLWPQFADWIWAGLIVTGVAVSLRFGPGNGAMQISQAWRIAASSLIFAAFFIATYRVLGPVGYLQQGAFPPLVVALIYMVLGLWIGWRFVVAGAAVGVLTLIGFYDLPRYFLLWQGIVGGGALILAGFWFRRI